MFPCTTYWAVEVEGNHSNAMATVAMVLHGNTSTAQHVVQRYLLYYWRLHLRIWVPGWGMSQRTLSALKIQVIMFQTYPRASSKYLTAFFACWSRPHNNSNQPLIARPWEYSKMTLVQVIALGLRKIFQHYPIHLIKNVILLQCSRAH